MTISANAVKEVKHFPQSHAWHSGASQRSLTSPEIPQVLLEIISDDPGDALYHPQHPETAAFIGSVPSENNYRKAQNMASETSLPPMTQNKLSQSVKEKH